MKKTSEWYSLLGDHAFPTVFVRLSAAEKELFSAKNIDQAVKEKLQKRLDASISHLPGKCFVGADACAPTDAQDFAKLKASANGVAAVELLLSSTKVKDSINSGESNSLAVRPYRRMDKTREFRLFIQKGELVGMSQYCLERQFRRLEGRRDELWTKACEFVSSISEFLPKENLVADIYFTSDGEVLVVDFNDWGGDTSPLLFKSWDHDFSKSGGLRLMSPPMKLSGDVKVSF